MLAGFTTSPVESPWLPGGRIEIDVDLSANLPRTARPWKAMDR